MKGLLTDDGEYRIQHPFDWVAEDETKISEEVKTEQDFPRAPDDGTRHMRRPPDARFL